MAVVVVFCLHEKHRPVVTLILVDLALRTGHEPFATANVVHLSHKLRHKKQEGWSKKARDQRIMIKDTGKQRRSQCLFIVAHHAQ